MTQPPDPQQALLDRLTDKDIREMMPTDAELAAERGAAVLPVEVPTPALHAWLKRGDTRTRDDLWRAACWEAAARDTFRSDPEYAVQQAQRALLGR